MAKKKEDNEQETPAGMLPAFPTGFETVEVEILNSPFHKEGHPTKMGKANAERLEKQGVLRIVSMILLFILAIGFQSKAQDVSVDAALWNKDYATKASDTVTNTGVAVLQSPRIPGSGTTTTISIVVVKQSGTVGGTISLLGSLDGTNYKALNTRETQTALATITATDASNVYHWRLDYSPFLYYRVSWTGTGTMAATVAGRILKH